MRQIGNQVNIITKKFPDKIHQPGQIQLIPMQVREKMDKGVSWYDKKGIIEIDGGTMDVQELGLRDDQLSNCLFVVQRLVVREQMLKGDSPF